MVHGGGARSNSSTPATVVIEIAIAFAVVAIALFEKYDRSIQSNGEVSPLK